MTSPTVAVQSTVKHDPSRPKQIESKVKLDYVLTPIIWVTSSGQTLEYGLMRHTKCVSYIRPLILDDSKVV